MKKIFLVFAILLANGVFTSCTDLDEDFDNKSESIEIQATDGEEEQDPDEEEDPANGG
ncbi:hypothetical protein [Polaribacter porphyrae]|uniref:hypothetical protein n=1 Tax=Polaribacter porphyrae TaxID=1137780 RepID=UPI0014760BA4|nr:hypothetical protein [Polaribacter porphyrae]